MQYCVTIERVKRIAVWYEADNDDEAREKGAEIFNEHINSDDSFIGGDTESDYSIVASDGATVEDWYS